MTCGPACDRACAWLGLQRAHFELLSFIQQKIKLPAINRKVGTQVVDIAKDPLYFIYTASRHCSGSVSFLEERHRRQVVRVRVGIDHVRD
jgi:hypothetical protein